MTKAPYRHHHHVIARAPTWWAGGLAYASLALAAVLWIGTLVGAYFRETYGMLGATLAVGPTAFGIATLLLAKRTRYALGRAGRVVAPLAAGGVAFIFATVAVTIFFATIWRAL